MIRFFWKYRYVNLTVLSLFFVLGCINFTSLNVYFDSERIIELSNVDDNIIEKSLDDKNLLLVGLKFSDSLTISQLQELRSKIEKMKTRQQGFIDMARAE